MPWAHDSRRKKELPPNWDSLRLQCLKRDAWRCVKCGAYANQVDHKIRGHDHRLQNLQSLCTDCHKKKTQWEAQAARREIHQRLRRPAEPHPGAIVREEGQHAPNAKEKRAAAALPRT